jgi:hypothetical protein
MLMFFVGNFFIWSFFIQVIFICFFFKCFFVLIKTFSVQEEGFFLTITMAMAIGQEEFDICSSLNCNRWLAIKRMLIDIIRYFLPQIWNVHAKQPLVPHF